MWFEAAVSALSQVDKDFRVWLANQSMARLQSYSAVRDSRLLTVRVFTDRTTTTLLLSEADNSEPGRNLTPRENDVLLLVANGRTSAETAHVLRISARTVEKHLEHIYGKLGVTNRHEAAARVFGQT